VYVITQANEVASCIRVGPVDRQVVFLAIEREPSIPDPSRPRCHPTTGPTAKRSVPAQS
jgi:hypothetical protein